MKRPRRPAKHVASKKTVKRIRKILKRKVPFRRSATGKILPPLDPDDWTPEEAAVFDIPKPPSGFAYQWAPFSRIEYMRSRGWSQVPFSRHPEMSQSTNFDGYIVYRDTALFQISSAIVDKELSRLKLMAKDMSADFDAITLAGQMGYDGRMGGYNGRWFILSPEFMGGNPVLSCEQLPPEHPPVDVEVTITLRVAASWSNAANYLEIPFGEYARRRIAQSGFLLSPDEDGIFAPFELTTKKVEI